MPQRTPLLCGFHHSVLYSRLLNPGFCPCFPLPLGEGPYSQLPFKTSLFFNPSSASSRPALSFDFLPPTRAILLSKLQPFLALRKNNLSTHSLFCSSRPRDFAPAPQDPHSDYTFGSRAFPCSPKIKLTHLCGSAILFPLTALMSALTDVGQADHSSSA